MRHKKKRVDRNSRAMNAIAGSKSVNHEVGRIVVVDDRWVRRLFMVSRLGNSATLKVSGSSSTLDQALHTLEGNGPVYVVVGEGMVNDETVGQVTRLRRDGRIRPFIFAPYPVRLHRTPYPFCGLLHAAMSDAEIESHLRNPCPVAAAPVRFSPRERAVADMTVAGLTHKAMAAELRCGIPTIQSYRRRAMQKLGVSTLAEFILRCRELSDYRERQDEDASP